MWIATTRGFYSVVEHRDDPNDVFVRARNEKDIEAIRELLPGGELIKTPTNDYPWRIRCSKTLWAAAVAALADEIDYGNFKDAVKDRQGDERANTYLGVWARLQDLDDRPHGTLGMRTGSCPECGASLFEADMGICPFCEQEAVA